MIDHNDPGYPGSDPLPPGDALSDRVWFTPFVDWSAFWASDIPDIQPSNYLIKSLLGAGEMSVIYGASGDGKSFFTLDLCLHVATGKAWRDHRTKPCGVIYLAGEGQASFARRIVAALGHLQIQAAPILFIPVSLPLTDPAIIEKIERVAHEQFTEIPLGLIVSDTLARNFGAGDENSSQDMGRYIAASDRLRQSTGAHILHVHHTGKDTTKGARGSYSLTAAADTVIEISRSDGLRTAEIKKLRDGDSDQSYGFSLRQVALGDDDEGDPITSCVVETQDICTMNKRKKLNERQQVWFDTIRSSITDQGEIGHISADMGPVKKIARATLYQALNWHGLIGCADDTKKTGTEISLSSGERSTVRNLLTQLKAKDYLNFNNQFVWLVQE